MKNVLISLFGLLTITIITIGGIFLLISNYQLVFAQNSSFVELSQDETRATNLYFSIKPLDTWIYQEYSDTAMVNWMGFGPLNAINLWPVELNNVADSNKTSLLAEFKQNEAYTIKNAPISNYVKFIIDNNSEYFGFSPDLNTTIDDEPAVRLTGIVSDAPDLENKQLLGWKNHIYVTLHKNDAYFFSLFGDPKSFDKYLPEFEQMIKTVKWIE